MQFLKDTFTKALFVAFALVSFTGVSQASQQIQLPLKSAVAAKLTAKCVWAPNDSSVCRARSSCPANPRGKTCAKYCTVNPYDVVCGDSYHEHYQPSGPSDVTPYPWAQSGSFCQENPWSISCQYEDELFGY